MEETRNEQSADATPLLDVDAVTPEAAPRIVVEADAQGQRPVPFDRARLRASVENAQRSGGASSTEPPELPDEIADIVSFTLRARADAAAPSGGSRSLVVPRAELGELVERALVQVGAVGTARSYIVARDRRARAGDGGSDASTSRSHPLVRGNSGPEPFRAHRIVAALVEETGLVPEEADRVAERVGNALKSSGLPSVSTALVRELVAGELLSLGHRAALRRHEAIGIPRHDLVRLFERSAPRQAGEPAAAAFEGRVAEEIVGRWAAAEVLSNEVADAHARGDLGVVDLGRMHAPLVRAAGVELLAPDREGPLGRARAWARVAEVARSTARGLYVEGLIGAPLEGADEPLATLAALGAAASSAGRPIELSRAIVEDGGARAGAWIDALDRAGAEGVAAPRLFLTWEEVSSAVVTGDAAGTAEAAAAAERCIERGSIVPVWSGDPNRSWVAPGLRRRAGDRGALALDGAVALNLPRLARRAGPWREEAFLEELHGALDLVFVALAERARFVARGRDAMGAPLAEVGSAAVVPVGLREALRILGDGLARADQGARVLGFLGDALERMRRRAGAGQLGRGAIDLDVELAVGVGALEAERFARLDAAQARHARQPRLFGDLPRPEDEVARTYGTGFGDLAAQGDAARVVPRAGALGVLLATVRSGALVPEAPGPRGAGGGTERDTTPVEGAQIEGIEAPGLLLDALAKLPRMAAWGRFAAVRSVASPDELERAPTTLF